MNSQTQSIALFVSNWIKWHRIMSGIYLIYVHHLSSRLCHCNKIIAPPNGERVQIINTANNIPRATFHIGWEMAKTVVDARGPGFGWEMLLDFPGYISRNFLEQGTKGWQMFRGCPGCPQDVWFIIVMFPQLSVCRKSGRKYVILLKNKGH